MLNVDFLKSGQQFTHTKKEPPTVRKSKYEKLEEFYNKGIKNN